MARDLSCPSGLAAYRRKADVPVAEGDPEPRRCHRCRWWHSGVKLTRRERKKRAEAKRTRPARNR
jgi:hypothetical protein